MKRAVLWLAAIALTVALTVLVFLPATWLGPMVEKQTGGRLTLGDAQGTLWRGSAFIGGAPGAGGAVTPLLPGRFAWRLSPLVLLGRVDLELENPQALTQPVQVDRQLVASGRSARRAIRLPAEGLAGLGAPLNTLAPSGVMQLSWTTLALARAGNTRGRQRPHRAVDAATWVRACRRFKPLGSYELAMDWRGQQAQLNLRTVRGALLLSGTGALNNGRLQFSGQAAAGRRV